MTGWAGLKVFGVPVETDSLEDSLNASYTALSQEGWQLMPHQRSQLRQPWFFSEDNKDNLDTDPFACDKEFEDNKTVVEDD